MQYVGHVTYELIYENEDTFETTQQFSSADQLFHLTSFAHLMNVQEMYSVEEVRLKEVYIQGLSYEITRDILDRMDATSAPLSDFNIQGKGDVAYGT